MWVFNLVMLHNSAPESGAKKCLSLVCCTTLLLQLGRLWTSAMRAYEDGHYYLHQSWMPGFSLLLFSFWELVGTRLTVAKKQVMSVRGLFNQSSFPDISVSQAVSFKINWGKFPYLTLTQRPHLQWCVVLCYESIDLPSKPMGKDWLSGIEGGCGESYCLSHTLF